MPDASHSSAAGSKTGYSWTSAFGWWDAGSDPLFKPDHRLGIAPHSHHLAHPDTKRRAAELIEVSGLLDHLERLPIVPAKEEDVLLVHEPKYVNRIKRESDENGGDLGDTVSPFGRGAFDLALLGAGAVTGMVDAVVSGRVKNGYALVHPPGHHAEPALGRGFCCFNNGSIAAEYAIKRLGLKKVAIVDLDVHHGNGAEKIFWERSDVLTISVHQDRCFPADSGFASARGTGAGLGYNFNIPLPPGCGNGAYVHALDTLVLPALRRFQPDLVVVACGLDPNQMDPLARMGVTADGFAQMTERMMDVARELGHDRLVYTQEGGYSPYYVPVCIHRVIETLAGVRTLDEDPYDHILTPQHGAALEPWQRAAVDALVGHLDAIV
ncbi:hypothetical protein JCM10207_005399 [Rhodosporidiobolus poonsookiae]